MILTNLETTEYQGKKNYYGTFDGQRAKIKKFEDVEIVEGADLDGYLKKWDYEGKTGFCFWKNEEKKASFGNVKEEMLTQIYEQNKEILSILKTPVLTSVNLTSGTGTGAKELITDDLPF